MSNRFHESEKLKTELLTSDRYLGRRVAVQFPSGNGTELRVHGVYKGKLRACSTSWDNLATEEYDLTRTIVKLQPETKDDIRWRDNLLEMRRAIYDH